MTHVYCAGNLIGRLMPDGKVRLSKGGILDLDMTEKLYGAVTFKSIGQRPPIRKSFRKWLRNSLRFIMENTAQFLPMFIYIVLLMGLEPTTELIIRLVSG